MAVAVAVAEWLPTMDMVAVVSVVARLPPPPPPVAMAVVVLSTVDMVVLPPLPLSLATGAGCGRGLDLRRPRLPPRGPTWLAMAPWLVWQLGPPPLPLPPPPLPLPPPLLPPPARLQRKGAELCSSPSGLRMM